MKLDTIKKIVSADFILYLNEKEMASILRCLEAVNGTTWRGLPEDLHELRDLIEKALRPQ